MTKNSYKVRISSLLKLSSFNTQTAEGRSRERYRRASLSTIAAGLSKVVSILTGLITVPLTIKYLGAERYGLWMTISSTIAMLTFADLGIGNGLLNAIAEANGKDDRSYAQTVVSSAFFTLASIAILLVVLFTATYPLITWSKVFNVTSDIAIREAGPTMMVLLGCFALNIILGITQRIQMGYQEDFKNQLWALTGFCFNLIAILCVIATQGGLPWLVLAFSGGSILAQIINSVTLFYRSKSWLFPSFNRFEWAVVKKIMGTGIWFLIFQILTVFGITGDNLIIAHILGTSAVTLYSIPQKLFGVAFIAPFIVRPLWPAFGEAIARGDKAWARKTLVRAILLCTIAGFIFSLFLLFFGKDIIEIWVGEGIIPSNYLLLGFAVWLLLISYGAPIQMFLNGCSLIKEQAILNFVSTSISIPLKIILLWHSKHIESIIWSSFFVYGIFYIFPITLLGIRYFSDKSRLSF